MDDPGIYIACLAGGAAVLGILLTAAATAPGRNARGERTPEGFTVSIGFAVIFVVLAACLLWGAR